MLIFNNKNIKKSNNYSIMSKFQLKFKMVHLIGLSMTKKFKLMSKTVNCKKMYLM